MKTLTTSELARAADINVQTVRYYERRGLLPRPPRTGAGYRQFPRDAVRRVRFIKQAQSLGFTLKEIKELLELRVRRGVDCADIRQLAREKVEDIRERIAQLAQMEEALAHLANRCRGRGPVEECPILDALDSGGAWTGAETNESR